MSGATVRRSGRVGRALDDAYTALLAALNDTEGTEEYDNVNAALHAVSEACAEHTAIQVRAERRRRGAA